MESNAIIQAHLFGRSQTTTSVGFSDASVSLLSANVTRKEAIIKNTSSKILYLCFFTPATSTTPIAIDPGDCWVEDRWLGLMYGIWEAGVSDGAAIITEVYE